MARDRAGRLAHGRPWTLVALCIVVWTAAPRVAAASDACAQAATTVTIQPVFEDGPEDKRNETTTRTVMPGTPCSGDLPASGTRSAWFKYEGTSTYGAVLTLVAGTADKEFELRAYDPAGRPLVASASSGSGQELFVPAVEGKAHGFVEIRLMAVGDDKAAGFTLTIRDVNASDHWRGQGHTRRVALSLAEYRDLVRFGRCDSADPDAKCLGKSEKGDKQALDPEACDESCVRSVHAIANRVVDWVDREHEPIVAFIGLDGIDRVVLVDGTAEAPVPPHHRSLGKVKDFWVVYFENDAAPFSTSIDVEFKPRALARDFEEFDPAGLTVSRASGSSGYRVVEVGVRRFRVRPPPVAMEVTISRRGPGYGLRQWRNTYRVRGWHSLQVGAGLFIPAKAVDVDRHELPAAVRPNGDLPDEVVITKEQARRPVFLTASVSLPQRRARVDNTFGRLAEYGWRAIPELVVGVGLPPTRSKAWYLGGSWPIAWDRVSLTMGTLLIRQNKLRPGFAVGDRFKGFDTQIESLTHDKWVATFTLGVTMELARSQ